MKQENQSENTKLPKVMHFKPHRCRHLFTVVYPDNFTNDTTSKTYILITFVCCRSYNKFYYY